MSRRPYYLHLKAFVLPTWKPWGEIEIFSRENGYFLFKFNLAEDVRKVLEGGPYLFDSRLLILQLWNRHVGLEHDVFSSLPIWIRFPNLRVPFFTP